MNAQTFLCLAGSLVLLALFSVDSRSDEPTSKLILRNGEWSTEIGPGYIKLNGPHQSEIRIEAGKLIPVENAEPILMPTPAVSLRGPNTLGAKVPASAGIRVDKSSSVTWASAPVFSRQDEANSSPATLEMRQFAAVLSAGVDEENGNREFAHVVFRGKDQEIGRFPRADAD